MGYYHTHLLESTTELTFLATVMFLTLQDFIHASQVGDSSYYLFKKVSKKELPEKKDYRKNEKQGKYNEKERYWTMTHHVCLKTETRPHVDLFGKLSLLSVTETQRTHEHTQCM